MHAFLALTLLLLLLLLPSYLDSFEKVIVPAHFHDYDEQFPDWITNVTLHKQHHYSVFLYQRENSSAPNYIGYNRGGENAIYYKYIVDHYYTFPDIAIFVHAKPREHQQRFLNYVSCISPNASYSSINNVYVTHRRTEFWGEYNIWIEQCWRDILKIAWNLTSDELSVRYPPTGELSVSTYCCQQFLISRNMVHKRSLEDWKQLQSKLSLDEVCHSGKPEYAHLYTKPSKLSAGLPEPVNPPELLWNYKPSMSLAERKSIPGSGRIIQGTSSEYLAHVIFGQQPLHIQPHTHEHYCNNYLPASICPGSPCVDLLDPHTYLENMLFKCEDRIDIYRYTDGTKRLFPNNVVFSSYGYKLGIIELRIIPCSVLDTIPDGPKMPMKGADNVRRKSNDNKNDIRVKKNVQ